MKILLVEDDELTREYVLAGLAGAGHSDRRYRRRD